MPDDPRPKPAPEAAGRDASGGGAAGPKLTGPELARAVLDAAKVRRESALPARRKPRGKRLRGYSGAGPDPRDPALFGDVLAKLVKVRGWQASAAEGAVFGAWERVVGADVASHCKPIKLADGELTIEAESTAWATQLRLLAAKLLIKIAAELGPNTVKRLRIHGPATPSWHRGPRRVAGRGPRDTYG